VIVDGHGASRGAAVVVAIENRGGSTPVSWRPDLGVPVEALRLGEEVGDVDILVNDAGFA
jgi:hypothetical protein